MCVEESDPRRRGGVAETGSTVRLTDDVMDMRMHMRLTNNDKPKLRRLSAGKYIRDGWVGMELVGPGVLGTHM